MSATDTVRFTREMGISHREFLRLLPQAVAPYPYSINGATIEIGDTGGSVTLRLAPEGQRHLGLLRLPVTEVEFEFRAVDEAAITAFMQRFELAYRRGGG